MHDLVSDFPKVPSSAKIYAHDFLSCLRGRAAETALAEVRKSMDMKAHDRRFLITTNLYLRLGPLQVQPGDIVYVFIGGEVPFVLGRADQELEYYWLVGECLLHVFISGEAMIGAGADSLKSTCTRKSGR